MSNLLQVLASCQQENSVSRSLAEYLVGQIGNDHPLDNIATRDLQHDIQLIDEAWIAASFTPSEERSAAMHQRLEHSDRLILEVQNADHIVIALPLYNFSVPASLKAWVDMIARPGLTFAPVASGFEGLLKDKRAYLVVVSGSTDIQGAMDYATDYLTHVLGFLGITHVHVFSAANLMRGDAEDIALQTKQVMNSNLARLTDGTSLVAGA